MRVRVLGHSGFVPCARALGRIVRVVCTLTLTLAIVGACESESNQIRTENLLLAQGEFFGLAWGGTQLERFYTVARAGVPTGTADDSHAPANLVAGAPAQPCELGASVSRYLPLAPRTSSKYVIGSPSPARIGLFDSIDDDGFGTLSFADIHCERRSFSVPDVDIGSDRLWFLYAPDLVNLKLAVLNRNHSVIYVDPWAEEQHEMASDVQGLVPFETGAWLLETNRLVRRNLEGQVVARRASNVEWFTLLGSPDDLVYKQTGEGWFVQRNDVVQRFSEDDPDLCDVRGLDGFKPNAIGYFRSCDKRELRIYVSPEEHYEYGALDNYQTTNGAILYTKTRDDTTSLWLIKSSAPKQVIPITERAHFIVDFMFWLHPGQLMVITHEPNMPTSVWLLDVDSPEHLFVPVTSGIIGYQFGSDGVAALYENGELVLMDRTLTQVIKRVPNALRSRFNFMFRGKAASLGYLDDVNVDTKLGRLELQLLKGDHFSLADDVREFQEVWWPERGILYAKGGVAPGIYFARVDIPCETTSDTAWACGF
ncbi:MAG: hypothetical protein RL701_7268 [Pseudomonadota bacterium]